MSEKFVPFHLETPHSNECVTDCGKWISILHLHAERWCITTEETVVALLKASKIRSGADQIARFNIDPEHPRHSLMLRDWAKQQCMSLRDVRESK